MNKRIQLIRQILQDKKLDGILLTSPQNRFYFSGFTGSTATLLITPKQLLLLTDSRYTVQSKAECPEFDIKDVQGKYTQFINEFAQNNQLKRLGFEGDDVTYDWYITYKNALPVVELESVNLLTVRVKKEPSEVKIMKEANIVAIEALKATLPHIKPGVSERHIETILVTEMKNRGASKESFETIVASGPRGALPHGHASDKIIEKGELVTIDFGAYYHGYCSDVTRTFAVGKPHSAELVKIYNIVKEAQQKAVEAVRPGLTCAAIDQVARQYIADQGYGPQFGHSTGHGLGVLIHEYPSVSGKSETVLEPGMVITIEPGIYIEGLGGVRIEDDVLVTANGHEVLTQYDKSLIQL